MGCKHFELVLQLVRLQLHTGLVYATDPTATGAEFALNVGTGFAVGSAFGTLGGILSRGSAPKVIRNTTNDIEQAPKL